MADEGKLSYFFLGMGIGVAVGILFAPKSGEETRRYLRDKADEGKDYLKKRSDDLIESAGEIVDRGKSAISRQKDQISAAVEAGRQAYREATQAPKEEPGPATGL
jgi:gas vesicle protein